ncbi:ACT domain-containing protein ACR3 isoform X1 [Salvia miltiorrhiza]|uniref:ACT domain-containing protein ACR3 isoform X1 n=2 Tax=Salvia miltiorrhiza TaxID=226208 RepID=UPI0025AC6AE6|nr:ACT domain-containing protein ACR3 isoform X1 [Salvia miltiorrhiza]XP_057795610.1 ACT domain-containing protein ACR3 isoform X1 [Salvia miltiorrhiza]XP_057795611.1 ACT domain-containing protein ACR3 isoform X1 [Salvia miltiorrhiza]
MGSWAYFDPEYETLSIRINPPQVSVDNSSCRECTLVKVDSMNKPGILLEVVQILTDLDLTITKAYISSDGGWFMDVFHVTDQHGQKISDSKTIEYIEKALGPKGNMSGLLKPSPGKRVGLGSMGDCTAIELIGPDRPGLLSEISAVLANLQINVAAAEVWTHNRRIACVLYVNDNITNRAVDDASRLAAMEEQLKNILRGCGTDDSVAYTSFSVGSTHIDRRLHQLFFADRDYEVTGTEPDYPVKPNVTIERCEEKDYSVVTVKCKDRPKLMFDIVCTLTDMQYVVFHATISSDGPFASQEYFIRHMDGCTLETEEEKEKAIKCLEAAIRRRTSEGLSLELCAKDRVGLLSEVTRILRENGLSVTRAGVTTVGEQAMNVFYVSDASGKPVDARTIEALRKEIGQTMRLNVKKAPMNTKALEASGWAKTSFFFGGLLEKFLP